MLVAFQRFARQWGLAATGVALVAVLATTVVRQTQAGPAPAVLSTLDLDRGEYNIGDAPNVTVRVQPITAAPLVDVEANLFFSEDPDPLVTAVLPAVLMGVIPNGDGELMLELDVITCLSPQLFLQGTITEPGTGNIFEITNDVYLKIDYNQGIDPSDIPDCVFQDIDIDGDGEPDIPANVPMGGQGCSADFWKQCSKSQDCAFPLPLFPDTLFSAVFEDAFPGKTLGQVLRRQTGGSEALRYLGQQAVAALLNAVSNEVAFDLTVSEVIALFNDAFPGTDEEYIDLKHFFLMFNNQGGSPLCTGFLIDLKPAGAVSAGGKRR